MKFTNRQIIILVGSQALGHAGALIEATGRMKPVLDEDGKAVRGPDKQVMVDTEPYELAPGARATLAIIMMKLRPLATAFDEARTGLVKAYTAKAKKLPEADAKWRDMPLSQVHPLFNAFQEELTAILDTEVEVARVPKVKLTDLKIDENRIPIEVIERMSLVLDADAALNAVPEDRPEAAAAKKK